ncbi:mitochondrial phosphate carrier protein 1, mitochondrial isoform X3 [Malania oleifera]|uniref:mitochondrial phosphate carrier protein 1, mitochondrial isoform X3 n=1 Tax=Malania oleifera TaxID=397392 RepID=UPI0025AE5050|nr:mitochondrial phosphate carrier protein 1, mitochondrial isoform X3 [Malania oleifera]
MTRRVEGGRLCEEFSPAGYYYYGICTAGGMLSAGTTHLAITPLDVLKVNMQVNPIKYNSISSGLTTLWKEQGASALWRGWSGKFFGYGIQGGFKFGLYEYFKNLYSDTLVDHNRSVIFFMSSASAQVFADVALCPFEAIKVRVQTQPSFAKGLVDGFPKLYMTEGLSGKKEDCSRAQQLGVTCLAGYAAGAFGTLISNPADNIVSLLYNKKAENVLQAVKNTGLVNLFTRSLPIRIAFVGPVITLQWLFYDAIKVLNGLPTSGELIKHLEEKSA